MSLYRCCEVCDSRDPRWSVARVGDVVATWACDSHLAQAVDRLQRDFEVTEVVVRDFRKALEWASIGRTLDQIARDGQP